MSLTRRVAGVLAIAVAVGAAVTGCGRRAGPAPGGRMDVRLPEWAPKNPSEEFLRAARVLKPMPMEELLGSGSADQAKQARKASKLAWLPGLYEFFGTMSDEQIERFLSGKEIHIPVKSLTSRQRDALDTWFEVYHEATRGTMPLELGSFEDYRVILYRQGAREDLSNLEVGFVVQGGHMVHIDFQVTREDGTVGGCCTNFAQI